MTDRGDQIQQLLQVLSSHGALVSEGLDGTVYWGGGKAKDKGIDALVSIHALTPYEENSYRLNPRLREFISDHLVSYNLLTTLTRLTEPIHRAKTQWSNLKEMRNGGFLSDAEKLEWALDDTVTEIVYVIDRNLTLLDSIISTSYGNVESVAFKIRQNHFYAREVERALKELAQLDAMIEHIDADSLAAGFVGVRQLMNVRLRSRLHTWSTRLNDIQARISKRLFQAQKIEKKLVTLGKMTLWLAQHKTSAGITVDLDYSCPIELLRPDHIRVSPQLDVRDTDSLVWDTLIDAVERMPTPLAFLSEATEEKLQVVEYTGIREITLQSDPVDDIIEQLADTIYQGMIEKVSLLHWKQSRRELDDVTEEEWLLYAASQLVSQGLQTEFQMVDRGAGVHNDLFDDVLVFAPDE